MLKRNDVVYAQHVFPLGVEILVYVRQKVLTRPVSHRTLGTECLMSLLDKQHFRCAITTHCWGKLNKSCATPLGQCSVSSLLRALLPCNLSFCWFCFVSFICIINHCHEDKYTLIPVSPYRELLTWSELFNIPPYGESLFEVKANAEKYHQDMQRSRFIITFFGHPDQAVTEA